MVFGLGKKKVKITAEQFGEGLWVLCKNSSKGDYEMLKTDLEGSKFSFSKDKEFYISGEIIIINLWIISKALESNKKSLSASLDTLYNIFLQECRATGSTDEEKNEIYKNTIDILNDRFNRYSKAWRNNTDGNQSVLSLEMLKCMLNNGEMNKELLDAEWLTIVNVMVLEKMTVVLNFYSNYKIIDS